MKKIICLVLASWIVLCCVACDMTSNAPRATQKPKELTIAELFTLIGENAENDNVGRVTKVSSDASVAASISGLSMNFTMTMVQYSKEDGENSVLASETKTSMPGTSEVQSDVKYYANGYLYTVIDGVTIKTESTFEEASGSSDIDSEEPTIEEVLNVIKESSIDVQPDGSYKAFMSVDTTKDISFLYDLLGGLDSEDGEMNISKMDVTLYANSSYLVESIEFDLAVSMTEDDPDMGSVNMVYTMTIKMELMAENFVIEIPDGVDIEHAIDSSHEEL